MNIEESKKRAIAIFINQHQGDFNKHDYHTIIFDARKDLDVEEYRAFIEILYKSGINPLKYLEASPLRYARRVPIGEIAIPGNCEIIGKESFSYSNLKEVVIREGVLEINESAFDNCTNLENLILPDSIKDMGKYAFFNCQKLEYIKIPKGLTYIPIGAFSNCGLKSLVMPSNIVRVDNYAFSKCEKLEKVSFTTSVQEFGAEVFKGCVSLKDIYFDGDALRLNTIHFGNDCFDGVVADLHCTDRVIKIGK